MDTLPIIIIIWSIVMLIWIIRWILNRRDQKEINDIQKNRSVVETTSLIRDNLDDSIGINDNDYINTMADDFEPGMIPDLIPIKRIEDYHTHYLGITSDKKQFWAYGTFLFSRPFNEIRQDGDWTKFRKEYAILHLFDLEGNHLDTQNYFAGTTSEIGDQALNVKLNEMVNNLGELDFLDIKVKPFKTTIDDVDFGLIVNEECGTVDLEPSSTLSFHEPWDGEYDT